MQGFMDFLWFVFLSGMWGLPWAMITVVGVWAFAHKKSKLLAVQTLGAGAYFLLLPLHWALMWLLVRVDAPSAVTYSADVVVRFLEWLALVVFAAGFCWEKWKAYKNEKVAAFPVEPPK